jgi:hypothetical protein
MLGCQGRFKHKSPRQAQELIVKAGETFSHLITMHIWELACYGFSSFKNLDRSLPAKGSRRGSSVSFELCRVSSRGTKYEIISEDNTPSTNLVHVVKGTLVCSWYSRGRSKMVLQNSMSWRPGLPAHLESSTQVSVICNPWCTSPLHF